MKNGVIISSAAVTFFAVATVPAYAYLDAATGSIIIQAVVGSIAGAMLFGRVYLAKAKAFLTRSKLPESDDADDA